MGPKSRHAAPPAARRAALRRPRHSSSPARDPAIRANEWTIIAGPSGRSGRRIGNAPDACAWDLPAAGRGRAGRGRLRSVRQEREDKRRRRKAAGGAGLPNCAAVLHSSPARRVVPRGAEPCGLDSGAAAYAVRPIASKGSGPPFDGLLDRGRRRCADARGAAAGAQLAALQRLRPIAAENRKTRASFECAERGRSESADPNAARNVAHRA